MKKHIYNLASWFLDKESIKELKENSEGSIIENLVEASGNSKNKVLILILIRAIFELARVSFAIFIILTFIVVLKDFYRVDAIDPINFGYFTGLILSFLLLNLPQKRWYLGLFIFFSSLYLFLYSTSSYQKLSIFTPFSNSLYQHLTGEVLNEDIAKIQLAGNLDFSEMQISFGKSEDINLSESSPLLTYSNTCGVMELRSGTALWDMKGIEKPIYLYQNPLDFDRYNIEFDGYNIYTTNKNNLITFNFIKADNPTNTQQNNIVLRQYCKSNLRVVEDAKIKITRANSGEEKYYILGIEDKDINKFQLTGDLEFLSCDKDIEKYPNHKLPENICTGIFSKSFIYLPIDSTIEFMKN